MSFALRQHRLNLCAKYLKTYYDHMKAYISFTTGYWKCNWANVKLIYAVMPQGKLYFDKKGTKLLST